MNSEPFIVKHYIGDEAPCIKGNGFDGLQVGTDREEAQEFIDFVNRVCAERDELASAAHRLLAELSTSDSETQVNLWKEIQGMKRALAELKL
jgi:hypothetical protein